MLRLGAELASLPQLHNHTLWVGAVYASSQR